MLNKSSSRTVALVMILVALVAQAENIGAQEDLLPDISVPVGDVFEFVFGFPPDTVLVTTFEYDFSETIVPGRLHLRISFGTANIGAGPIMFRGINASPGDTLVEARPADFSHRQFVVGAPRRFS